MLSRSLLAIGLVGGIVFALAEAGRQRRAQHSKRELKEDLSRWEDEGGNHRPERSLGSSARNDIRDYGHPA